MIKLSVLIYKDGNGNQSLLTKKFFSKEIKKVPEQTIELVEVEPEQSFSKDIQKSIIKTHGLYVFIFRETSSLNDDALKIFYDYITDNNDEDNNVLCIRSDYLNSKNNIEKYINPGEDLYVNLNTNPDYFNPCIDSYIIPRKYIDEDFFIKGATEEGMIYGLLEKINSLKEYYFIPGCKVIFSVAKENDSYNYSEMYKIEWYTKTIEDFYIPMIRKYDSLFIQHALYYYFCAKYNANRNDRDKTILNKKEVAKFFKVSLDFLNLLRDEVILETNPFTPKLLPKSIHYVFLKNKHNGVNYTKVYSNDKKIVASLNDCFIEDSNVCRMSIRAINNEKESLVIDGLITNSYFLDFEGFVVFGQINSNIIKAKKTDIYSYDKYFGTTFFKDYTYQIVIPKALIFHNCVIHIRVKYRDFIYNFPLSFSKPAARLVNSFNHSYWTFDDWIMKYYNDSKMSKYGLLIQKKFNNRTIFSCERKLLEEYFKKFIKTKKIRFIKCIFARLLYWLTKPFYSKKEVWVTYDQLFKGGDNGEYFFKYVLDNIKNDNLKLYYIINKDAREYSELKSKYGKYILEYKSIRCRIMSLHAKIIFATRVDVKLFCGFTGDLETYFRDLFNADIFCLQHGLTIQKIAQYQNRLFDNTKLYFLASKYELKNLKHYTYGYENNNLVITGAPRYDGLLSESKKQILITPTWRRNVTAGTNTKGMRNEYSVNFKDTEYFKIYNSLINNERMINSIKDKGYSIIFLIHPILSQQMNDYDKNDYVSIIPGSEVDYEKLLKESSIMITDYSGIQFDFAYMKKPVVYYHPSKLPPQYDSGGIKYDSMGFGPVCLQEKDVVDCIIRYVENDCIMEDKYIKRVYDFFEYSDNNNSKRVYEATMDYINNR